MTYQFLYAYDADSQLVSRCRYSKKRHSPHRRWKTRLLGMYPNAVFMNFKFYCFPRLFDQR